MELKSGSTPKIATFTQFKSHLYGIEIAVSALGVVCTLRLNRTFMELKLLKKWIMSKGSNLFKSHLYGIEIHTYVVLLRVAGRLNRTFMELKFKSLLLEFIEQSV